MAKYRHYPKEITLPSSTVLLRQENLRTVYMRQQEVLTEKVESVGWQQKEGAKNTEITPP